MTFVLSHVVYWKYWYGEAIKIEKILEKCKLRCCQNFLKGFKDLPGSRNQVDWLPLDTLNLGSGPKQTLGPTVTKNKIL